MVWDQELPAAEFHRVPADLVDVFDFLNTLDERTFGGRQPDDDLPRWLGLRGADDLALAVELRAVLRELTVANRTGDPPESLAERLAAVGERIPLRVDGRLGLRGDGALAEVLGAVTVAAANGSWLRMKSCGAPDCGWVFYDHSKPHNARWCSTIGCGNRMKTRAYRTARRTAGTGA